MASIQCYKAAEQTCYQGQYYGTQPSLVNTETQCASKTLTYYSDSGLAKTESAQCYSQTETNNPRHTHGHGHSHSHGQTHGHGLGLGLGLHLGGLTHSHSSTHGHGLTQTPGLGDTNSCNGTAAASGCRTSKKRSEHRGLFQKLKDRLSGDSSCSSSDSESDDEHCARRKPSC